MLMNLSMSEVMLHPQLVTYNFELLTYGKISLRPLTAGDVDKLSAFLAQLSPATRRFKFFPSYDFATAKALCARIRRLDKLLLVVELSSSQKIIGLFEFSFEISEDDKVRFQRFDVHLDESTTCRIGLSLADEYQNNGVGSILFPAIIGIARKFGRERMILWGGFFVITGGRSDSMKNMAFAWSENLQAKMTDRLST